MLVNNHDPKHLHDEFDTDYPGGYQWTYLERGPQVWRILIGKRASTALPQTLVNTAATAGPDGADVTGAVWKLPIAERDLDSNIVALAPGWRHRCPHGSRSRRPDPRPVGQRPADHRVGHARCAEPGDLVWLPRRSRRSFSAGDQGLRYLTVHRRRKAPALQPPEPRETPVTC